MTTSAGASVGIVGILAQRELQPHASGVTAAAQPAVATTSRQRDVKEEQEQQPLASAARTRQGYVTAPIDPSTTHGRKIALILHGALSHKDQTYHKALVQALPFDSFRFDFRANAETPGTWSISGLDDDLEDLNAVVHHLRNQLGYTIEVVVAHSRGSIGAFAWFTRHCPDSLPPTHRVPYFVALGTRFNMARIQARTARFMSAFKRDGFYRLQARIASEDREMLIYPEQMEQFANWPTAEIARDFPTKTDVLLVHGTADKIVPVSDVASYANTLHSVPRRPGSCVLQLVENADHNFKGLYNELVACIVDWLHERALPISSSLSAGALRDAEVSSLAAAKSHL